MVLYLAFISCCVSFAQIFPQPNVCIDNHSMDVQSIDIYSEYQTYSQQTVSFKADQSISRRIPPDCTSLTLPMNGSNDIIPGTNISWLPVSGATGYLISIGTSPGVYDIVDNLDVGNVTTYDPPTYLPLESDVYVVITPYNATEMAVGCAEEMFTIRGLLPDCTILSSPEGNSTNNPVDTNISWFPVDGAIGYFINIGTDSGVWDIVDTLDLGNVTTYDPPMDLPIANEIFVLITPYRVVGETLVSCEEEAFSTVPLVPNCTTLSSPQNNSQNVPVDSNISWNGVVGATGYIVTIGTTAGANDILNSVDVGNVTTYNLVSDLPESTEIFVRIIPYNSAGNATGCTEESFTTETSATIPACTSLVSPLNGSVNVPTSTDLSWNAIPDADGYLLTIISSTEGILLDSFDVGNVTTYSPTFEFPQGSTIHVLIVPYNEVGNALGCSEEGFTLLANPPQCAYMTFPAPGAIDVPVNIPVIIWNPPGHNTYSVAGYYVTVGTSPNGGEILNNVDVGNGTGYYLLEDLPENQLIYVTVVPYNYVGIAIGCQASTFKTEMKSASLEIPKFFTPNGDNTNDVWQVKDQDHTVKDIYIFNRYGKLLHTMNTFTRGWNGIYNNQLLPSDDYWYQITLIDGRKISGHFTLKR